MDKVVELRSGIDRGHNGHNRRSNVLGAGCMYYTRRSLTVTWRGNKLIPARLSSRHRRPTIQRPPSVGQSSYACVPCRLQGPGGVRGRADELKFHGSSFLVASSPHARHARLLASMLQECRTCRACRATSPFSLPRAYLIGRPAVCLSLIHISEPTRPY